MRQGSRIFGFLKGVLMGLLVVVAAIALLVLLTPPPEEVTSLEPEQELVALDPVEVEAEPAGEAVVEPSEAGEEAIAPVEIEGLGPVLEPEDPFAEFEEAEGEAADGDPAAADPAAADGSEAPAIGAEALAEAEQTLPYLNPDETPPAEVTGEPAAAEPAEVAEAPAMPPPLPDAAALSLAGPALEVNAARFDAAEGAPLISVIIDDAAGGELPADALFALPLPVTLGIVPGREGDEALARTARSRNWEVLAQLPVADGADGPAGALAEGMEEDELRARTEALLARLNQAVAATGGQALGEAAAPVLMTLEEHGFGYLGDGTASAGGPASARIDQSVPRDASAEDAVAALDAALASAGQDGTAIVVLPPTRAALEGLIRWALERGAEAGTLAPVSAVIRRQGAG